MLGLRSPDAELRANFFAIIDRAVERTPFARLHHIIEKQDWEPLGPTLWLRQATQLLLAIATPDAPLAQPPPGLRLATLQLHDSGAPASAAQAPLATTLATHRRFLADCASGASLGELLAPLSELLHDAGAPQLTFALWVTLFPRAWAQLRAEEQEALVKPLIGLLSREWHRLQASAGLNVVQGWLQALLACRPMPKIPAAVLQYLGKTFNAWHLAIPMLEHHALLYPNEPQWYDALSALRTALGERDSFCSLWSRRATHPETRLALALEQYGAWTAAQQAYVDCMTRWQAGETVLVNTPRAELQLWEYGVLRSAKKLNQWELLSEFAKQTQQPQLLMECSWKTSAWDLLKDLFYKYSLPDVPGIKMLQTYAAIHEGKLSEAEARCNDGIQFALQEWCGLPPLGVQSHTPLLQMFQQFQELQESAQMLMELNNAQRVGSIPDLSSILNTWRERLPNTWEELPAWNDLISWRNHMFSHINNVLGRLAEVPRHAEAKPGLASLGYQEMVWTVVRFAHVARRHALPEACVNIIAKLQSVSTGIAAVDLNDTFSKMREQVRSCLQMPGLVPHGMQMLSQTDIDQLSKLQQAELFQLKAELLLTETADAADNGTAEAEAATAHLATAISMHGALPKAWLLWGGWCDRTFRKGGDVVWADRALGCYMQAILLRLDRARSMIPRVLALLAAAGQHGEKARESLAQTFAKYCDGVLLHEWLPWLPQLVRAAGQVEGPMVQHLLTRIAHIYPQPLYHALRCFSLDDDKPDADPCAPCFHALGVGVTNTLGAAQADDLAPMLGVKASKD